MIATRSPRPILQAISPLARARTSARNSSLVTSIQVPDDGLQNATLAGWLAGAIEDRQIRKVARDWRRDERGNRNIFHEGSLDCHVGGVARGPGLSRDRPNVRVTNLTGVVPHGWIR